MALTLELIQDSACLLCLPLAVILSVAQWKFTSKELSVPSQRRHLCISYLFWSLHPLGTDTSSAIAVISFHTWLESCLLGT